MDVDNLYYEKSWLLIDKVQMTGFVATNPGGGKENIFCNIYQPGNLQINSVMIDDDAEWIISEIISKMIIN